MRTALTLAAAAAVLGGCASSPASTCPDPSGLSCMSQSDIHAAVQDGRLEALQRQQRGEPAEAAPEPYAGWTPAPLVRSVEPGDPLFVAPRPMRIWFADWRDASDDLHSESYLYIRVGRGTWRIGERVAP